jgi:hypothetical protein
MLDKSISFNNKAEANAYGTSCANFYKFLNMKFLGTEEEGGWHFCIYTFITEPNTLVWAGEASDLT